MNSRTLLAASVCLACASIVCGQAVPPASVPATTSATTPSSNPSTTPATGRGGARGAGGRAAAPAYVPTAEERAALTTKLNELWAAINALKEAKADDTLIVDAESCAWIVHNILRVPGGFIEANYVGRCTTLLNDGLRRAAEIKAGTAAWPKLTGRVNRAYRSTVDGTAQPYHLTVPANYDPARPTPLFVYLHGRSQYDPDLGLGWAGGNDRGPAPGAVPGNGGGNNNFRVEAFGRANNSFRWLGEADVLEVIAALQKRYNIDPERIILSGFSLGGAGSWQLGLHHPDLFCGFEIDAGVIGNRTTLEGMSAVERAALSTYGIMIDHAVNTMNVPLVGYAGANDAQLASSTAMRKQLIAEGFNFEQVNPNLIKGTDINALFISMPGQGHSHAAGEWLRMINTFNDENFKRGRIIPDHIRFVTYTTRYNRNHWITIDGLKEHFTRASIDAKRDPAKATYTIKSTNISRLLLTDVKAPAAVTIDSDTLQVTPSREFTVLLTNTAGRWQVTQPGTSTGLVKRNKLQGPINDAFLDSFLCVAPTGTPFNALAHARALQEHDRFYKMTARDYLGEARTKPDSAVSDADIAANNLILFGDPGSNALLARIADKLPIKWTRDSIVMGGQTYSAADHLPVMIYPNPLNPTRYVVINTGLSAERGGAVYGDYALLKLSAQAAAPAQPTTNASASASAAAPAAIMTTVVIGGVFDESWQLPATK